MKAGNFAGLADEFRSILVVLEEWRQDGRRGEMTIHARIKMGTAEPGDLTIQIPARRGDMQQSN